MESPDKDDLESTFGEDIYNSSKMNIHDDLNPTSQEESCVESSQSQFSLNILEGILPTKKKEEKTRKRKSCGICKSPGHTRRKCPMMR